MTMQITIEIPDNIARRLEQQVGNLPKRVLASVVAEAYRSQLISAAEVQQVLHLSSRLATDAFLKQHEAYLPYTETDIEQDLQAIDRAFAPSFRDATKTVTLKK
jgi:hypothetical protein